MKAIAADTVFIMMFIGICLVSFIVIVPRMLNDIGRNFCVRDQFTEISKIEEIAREMSLGMEKASGFDVKWCTKCIWYEENGTHKWLNIQFKGEASPAKRFVENTYLNIGRSGGESRLNKDDFEYSFWIKKNEVNCTNCFDETINPGCP
ncbi:MAG: hypothetical protein QXP77_00080 [Candidatus Aenigmatarchaeota archaeon]